MVSPISVKALPKHRLFIRFSDGVAGEVDLSDLAGRGVFAAWDDPVFFNRVHVGPHRQIRWDDEVELCPDSLYMKLTGKTPQEYFAASGAEHAHA